MGNSDETKSYFVRLGCGLESDMMDKLLVLKDAQQIIITDDRETNFLTIAVLLS
ncbi:MULTISPECIES: hypothetical protein [unclassified Bartonella]|uniref:hypothetical protein n=1 Tax=unclassified Bartonella TaxID=2645622 RepID=UPI0015FE17EB|nr:MULTISPECIES: hypothetical protein [unclassified Bartonella]UXN03212.1 hypothetical protein N6B01_12215 [Bartonella sp. HY406]